MNNRQMLLKRVQVCDFVLLETNEFLDTHPDNAEALRYFKKYQDMRKDAVKEYEEKYGPLTAAGYCGYTNRFTYVDNPWPWEVEA